MDVGLELFKPKRAGEVDATGVGVPDLGNGARQGALSSEKSRSNGFFLPHLGVSKAWSERVTFGIAMIGNGGMNTRYGDANTGTGNIYTTAFAPVIGDTRRVLPVLWKPVPSVPRCRPRSLIRIWPICT